MPDRPLTIGITGGIGAGKSTLADAFAALGAVRFSADDAVHKLYLDPEVQAELRARWGERPFREDGTVARERIAEIVFADRAELEWLEGLIHPLVARNWLRFVHEQSELDNPPSAIVAEVPLLFEAGVEDRYDTIVAVTAPLDVRLKRVGERAHGASHAEERNRRQLGEDEKASRADHVFSNVGDIAEAEVFARSVLEQV